MPDELPATSGRVIGVEVVNQGYRLSQPRTYVPIDGDVVLRAVDRSPAWFGGGTEDTLAQVMREESGVLVLLDVGSTAASD